MVEWSDGRKMTHDELLLWLNGHVRRTVAATVEVDKPEVPFAAVLHAVGELRHWTASAPPSAWAARGGDRDDIAGLYEIGDATSDRLVQLDVTELAPFDASFAGIDNPPDATPWMRAEQIRIGLGENMTLQLIVYIEPGG
jgi:hypothetical protein